MPIDNARIKTLDQELRELKKAVDRMYQLTSVERLNYAMIESQFENLKARNQEWVNKNSEAEKKLQETLSATEQIMNQTRQEEARQKAEIQVMWTKARGRYQELEKMFDMTDKKVIKEHLKSLEAVAA